MYLNTQFCYYQMNFSENTHFSASVVLLHTLSFCIYLTRIWPVFRQSKSTQGITNVLNILLHCSYPDFSDDCLSITMLLPSKQVT